jgi:RNA polymerase sigma-70 factor (ECF subfamily)
MRSESLGTIDVSEARDRDLLRRLLTRDEEAFRGLFGRYAPAAKALALRVVRQQHLAEEIVQEAFLAVWRNPAAYEEQRGSVKTWLMGMVHHRAVDAVRREESQRRRAEAEATMATTESVDHAEDVVTALGAPQERAAVRTALRSIPDEQRAVLEMMYFDGLSQSQIAERSGLPLGTVKSRTLLGMRRLRSALEGIER